MSKINLTLRPFNLKLKHPFGISRGTTDQVKNVLIKLEFDDVIAYGEAAPSRYYGEDESTVIEFLQVFKKHTSLDKYLTSVNQLKDDLDNFSRSTFGNAFSSAKVGLEMAFWDLIGKINNKPLYEYFFQEDPFFKGKNNYKNLQPTSFTIGLDNAWIMESKVKEAIKDGYKILKIKLGRDYDENLNILKTVCNAIKENSCKIRVDANGGWDLEVAKRMLDVLPSYNVEILEQPLARGQVNLISKITALSSIPIFVDEDCVLLNDIELLAGKVHGVNIKLMKSGSVMEAFRMINLAKSYNLKVMLGCMIESSCGISAAVHLSPLADYIDLDGHLLLEDDPFSGLQIEDNKIIPSFEAGLGVSFLP